MPATLAAPTSRRHHLPRPSLGGGFARRCACAALLLARRPPAAGAATEAPSVAVQWRLLEVTGGSSGSVTLSTAVAGPDTASHRFLCLHGFPDQSLSWVVYLLPELARVFNGDLQLVAPDLRGTNRSRPKFSDWREYAMEKLANDVGLLWKQHFATQGTPDFWLLGHDFGAGIAWTMAGLFPSTNLKGVVAMSIPFPQADVPSERQTANGAYRALYAHPAVSFVAATSQNYKPMEGILSTLPGFELLSDAYREAWDHENSLLYHLMWYEAAMKLPETRALPDPLVPALFLYGVKDMVASGGTRCCQMLFVQQLYIGQLNTSQWVFQEDPEAVARAIGQFVRSDPAPTMYQESEDFCSDHPEFWSEDTRHLCVERTNHVGNFTVKPEWPMDVHTRKLRMLSRQCDVALDGSCPSTASATHCLTEVLSAECIRTFCDDLAMLQGCVDALGDHQYCEVFRSLTLFDLAKRLFCDLESKALVDVIREAGIFNVSKRTSKNSAEHDGLTWVRDLGPVMATIGLVAAVCAIARTPQQPDQCGAERLVEDRDSSDHDQAPAKYRGGKGRALAAVIPEMEKNVSVYSGV